jgi:hypothetical protein
LTSDERSSAERASAPPECLEFSEGWSPFSAFSISAFGRESIELVGRWLEDVFVPVVMPLILDCLAEPHFSLTKKANDFDGSRFVGLRIVLLFLTSIKRSAIE